MIPPVALTVAGSDSGGGAGVQADLKTFAAHGVYGVSALTLVTAQNTLGVGQVYALPPALVVAQLEAVLSDFPVRAVKVGALGNAALIRAVAGVLRGAKLPLVLDPVMFAKGGARLLDEEGVEALGRELLPLAALVTPNLPEAVALRAFLDLHGCPGGGVPLLLKGGHAGGEGVEDLLLLGGVSHRFLAPRRHTRHTHGTGCTLSSAVAARLAQGAGLIEAVGDAHAYVQAALSEAPGLGAGHGPLHHFPGGLLTPFRDAAGTFPPHATHPSPQEPA
ncbi:MAG: bifunctional hydroxymethylpyrimidine kinase/phosphomethylpyrimidine kinase [Deinococcus sp.]